MTAPRGSFALRLALVLLFACDAPAFAPPEEPGELRFGDGAPLGPEGEGVVAFDPVEAGSVATLALPIENRGRTPLSLTVDELSAPFFLARVPAGLPAEKGDAVVFGFQPETAGTFEAWTRIRSEGGDLRVRLYATGTKEGSCLLTIAPEELRFSIPSPAFDLPLRASVRLSNEGTRTCRVESLRVVGDEAFRLGARRFEDLPPGATGDVEIHFSGESGAEAELIVVAEGVERRVALGTKAENDCLAWGDGHGFLAVEGFECAPARAVVENRCERPIRIGALASPSDFVPFVERDQILPALGHAEISVDFRPFRPSEAAMGTVAVVAENGDTLVRELEGKLRWAEERFHPEPTETMDILFVVDDALEMGEYVHQLEDLALGFSEMLAWHWPFDARLMVTTTSMSAEGDCGGEAGQLRPVDGSGPTVVGWDTPDREEALLRNLVVEPCATRSGAGLEAISAALGDGRPEWRRGWLSVVLVSVGDDASPLPVEHYRSRFASALGRGRYVDFLALLVPTEDCPDHEPASRYAEMAPSAVRPICRASSWKDLIYTGGSRYEALLGHRVADLNGDGRFDEHDGVVLLVDGRPRLESTWVRRDRLDASSSVGSIFPRGATLDLRYPVDCR